MSMMGMTGVLIALYFITITAIMAFSKEQPKKDLDWIFLTINLITFLGLNIFYFQKDGKITFLSFDNISPFTFTFMIFIGLFKEKLAYAFRCAIAFLSVGMIIAMMITPQYAYIYSFVEEARIDYLLDALGHMNCSLYGIYLVASGKVKLTLPNFSRAAIFMYTVITGVVITNALFHKNFFGMCPYGGYSIYMFNLFEEYWATLLAYYLGVLAVLYLGFGFNYALNRLNRSKFAFDEAFYEKRRLKKQGAAAMNEQH
jgi:hypothetical protein